VKRKLWFKGQNNVKAQSIVAPLCSQDYYAVNLLVDMKQMVVVSPLYNAFRQKGSMSSGRSVAKLFNSHGSNRKYPGKR
jgi:hypothetical protein